MRHALSRRRRPCQRAPSHRRPDFERGAEAVDLRGERLALPFCGAIPRQVLPSGHVFEQDSSPKARARLILTNPLQFTAPEQVSEDPVDGSSADQAVKLPL